jgi:hypothetical protein
MPPEKVRSGLTHAIGVNERALKENLSQPRHYLSGAAAGLTIIATLATLNRPRVSKRTYHLPILREVYQRSASIETCVGHLARLIIRPVEWEKRHVHVN